MTRRRHAVTGTGGGHGSGRVDLEELATGVDMNAFAAEFCAGMAAMESRLTWCFAGAMAAVGAIRCSVGSRGTMTAHEAALLP